MIKTALLRLGKNSVIYGISGSLHKVMGLLLLPFFTRVLTPEDYGVVALITFVVVAMSGLLTLGTGNSMGLLYFREQEMAKRPVLIWSNSLLMAVNGFFWYTLIFLLAPTLSGWMFQTDRYGDLIRLALLSSIFTTIADPWLAYLRMEEKAMRYVAITFISAILTITLSVWLVLVLQIGVLGLILAGTLAQGIMLLVIWVFIGRKLNFGIDMRLFMPLVRIGFPSVFGLFAWLFIGFVDRQMIERMLGLTELGVYSIGYNFGMVMTVAMGAFATAWPPFYMSYIHKQVEARVIFARVLTYYLIGFGSLVVLFFFMAKPIVLLMTAPAFHEAFWVIGLVAAGYALKGAYLIVLPGISFAEKLYKQSIVLWVVAFVNVGLNFILIPMSGIFGAAIATFLSFVLLFVLIGVVSQKYLQISFEWERIALISISVFVFSGLLFYFSVTIGDAVTMLVVNAFTLLGFIVFGYGVLIKETERRYIAKRFSEIFVIS